MDPNHHGQVGSILRRKDVEEQTIFIVPCILFTCLELRITERVLRTLRAVPTSIDDLASVEARWLGCFPTKITCRRSGETDALPRVDVGGRVECATVL